MKYATKEMAEKWLDGKIAAKKKLMVDLQLDKTTVAEMCGVSTDIHLYKATSVVKLAKLLGIEYTIDDPWCDRYPNHVYVQFMYKGCRVHAIELKEVWENEKTEIAD